MNIGLIGCGAMGKGIAKNLVKSGYTVYAYDRDPHVLEKCVEVGVHPAESPFEIGRKVDGVITSLPGPAIVKEVMIGEGGVFAALKPGSFVLDMSTIDPMTVKDLFHEAKRKEIAFFDCPLSGGPVGADQGTLTIMVGGNQEELVNIQPVLESVGKDIFYLGESGSGQIAKLCHNMLVATITTGLGEALAVGEKAGVSRRQLAEVIQSGSAQNRVLSVFGENILKNTYENVLFSLQHMSKDIHLYMETASNYEVNSPIGEIVSGIYQKAMDQGKGMLDSSAVCQSS